AGGRGARSYPHPHRRGPQPGTEARAAHGPETEIDRGAAGRGPQAAGRRCHACGTRAQLPRGPKHDFAAVRRRAIPRSSKMRTCWAAILGGCDGPLTGEHLFSKGLFSGKSVQVQGNLWKSSKPKAIGINSLTANILCRKHNNALAPVDAEGIRAFRAIR